MEYLDKPGNNERATNIYKRINLIFKSIEIYLPRGKMEKILNELNSS